MGNSLKPRAELEIFLDAGFAVPRRILWQIADSLADTQRIRYRITTVNKNAAGSRRKKRREHTQDRRFPCAIGPDQAHDSALAVTSCADLEADAVDRPQRPETFAQFADDDRHARSFPGTRNLPAITPETREAKRS